MYHYVRAYDAKYPKFKYLHIEDFGRQLDYLSEHFRLISLDEFMEITSNSEELPVDVALLTFDDGFSDHYFHVLPELRKRGTFGFFYVPTAPLENGELLDVHKIHLLTGRVDGQVLLKQLSALAKDDMFPGQKLSDFRNLTYRNQDNAESVTHFKRALNYFIDYGSRKDILNILMSINQVESDPGKFYLSAAQIREMHDSGMLIGSHSVSHLVFSKLALQEQRFEIEHSFDLLANIVGEFRIKTFCYPYGGFHSFNPTTEILLDQAGCRFAFNVESRDVSRRDFNSRPQALPRYDCNEFPYGQTRGGREEAPRD